MPAPIVEQIIHAAYGGTDTLERVDMDIETTVREELDKPTPCEAKCHSTGTLGHEPAAFAAFWCIPACGHDIMLCAATVRWGLSGKFDHYYCQCTARTPLREVSFIPLNTEG